MAKDKAAPSQASGKNRRDTVQDKLEEFEKDSIEAACYLLGIPDPLTIGLKIAAGTLYKDDPDPDLRGKKIPLRDRREMVGRLIGFQKAPKQAKLEIEHSGEVTQTITHDISPSMAQVKELLAQLPDKTNDPAEHKIPATNHPDDIIEGEVIPTEDEDTA